MCLIATTRKSCLTGLTILRVFDSVVVVAFQIVFRAEIHANDIFLFFKNHFWYQHIKTIQKVQTALNFNKKKKILKFNEKQDKAKRSLYALYATTGARGLYVASSVAAHSRLILQYKDQLTWKRRGHGILGRTTTLHR